MIFIFKWLCNAFLLFSIAYLLGAFYNLSIDLRTWDEVSRGLVAIIGGVVSLVIGAAMADPAKTTN